jgi:hypothetical protein
MPGAHRTIVSVAGGVIEQSKGADMKLIFQRVCKSFALVLAIGIVVGQVVAGAQPKAISQVYLPFVAKQPTPTPTAIPSPTPRTLYALGPVGGSGGDNAFQDGVPDSGTPTQLIIRSGAAIDGVQMVLNIGALGYHGGSGGSQNVINLASDEYITGISGTAGYFLDWGVYIVLQLTVQTNKASYGPYGAGGGDVFNLTVPGGYEIVGFFGRHGTLLDSLGVLYRIHR